MRRLPGADGLLFLDGEAWVKRLRALTPVFHATNLDRLAGHIHATAAVHARTWRERGTVDDLYTCVVRLGAAIVLRIGYGLDPASAVGQRLASALLAYKAETLSEDPRRRLDEFGAGPEKVLDLPWILRTIFGMGRRMRGLQGLQPVLPEEGRSGRHLIREDARGVGLLPAEFQLLS